jgi:hypothetical protein
MGEAAIRNGVALSARMAAALAALRSALLGFRFAIRFDLLGFVERRLRLGSVAGPAVLIIAFLIGVAVGV